MAKTRISCSVVVFGLLYVSSHYWLFLLSPVIDCLAMLCISWFIGSRIGRHLLLQKVFPRVEGKNKVVLITGE